MERAQLFTTIANIANNAFDSTDEDDVQSWDAYEAAKRIVTQLKEHGYDMEYMLEEIAEEQ